MVTTDMSFPPLVFTGYSKNFITGSLHAVHPAEHPKPGHRSDDHGVCVLPKHNSTAAIEMQVFSINMYIKL